MVLNEVNPATGLPKVAETRRPAVLDPARFHCTCSFGTCLWHPIPRKPYLGKIHEAQAKGKWYPQYQSWENGIPVETKCWKCGTPIKNWRIKLNLDGTLFTMPGTGQVGVWHAPLANYRAKPFVTYLPLLDERVQFDVLHCADCEIKTEDGEIILACYLAGLWDAHRQTMNFLQLDPMTMPVQPDTIATMLFEWGGAEPVGPIHRSASDSQSPPWRS